MFFRFQKKYLQSPHCSKLADIRYEILKREWQNDVELFRDENIPLQTEEKKLNNEYDKLCGAMMPEFRGKKYTIQQLVPFLEEQDRQTRKEAGLTIAKRWDEDRNKMDDLFNKLQKLRSSQAKNTDLSDYRTYKWKSMRRFDYSPQDCEQFANSVEITCMPLLDKIYKKRAKELGVETLRPWDLMVDPENRPPLRPFDPKKPEELVDKTQQIINRISPALATEFATLLPVRNLDLDSRKGKRPGGYQLSLQESQEPFIFMNASGIHSDVMTLLHESGHAFHFLAASRNEPIVFLRRPPTEFCEVASTSMELIGSDYFEIIYNQDDAARAKRKLFEENVAILPWIAIIDSFQHWLYTNQGHSNEERTDYWLKLFNRFNSNLVDWSGYETYREARWQRQLHLFHIPFYYIEYGIALLGSFQLWLNYKEDPERALANYQTALALGGSRPLPELFETAGIKFDFSQSMLQKIMDAIEKELDELSH